MLTAALVVTCLTYVMDRFIWGSVHRDESGTLVYNTWIGLEPPTFCALLCGVCIVLLPIAGGVVQSRPLFPRLATFKAFLIAVPITAIAIVAAVVLSFGAQMSWMWVLFD